MGQPIAIILVAHPFAAKKKKKKGAGAIGFEEGVSPGAVGP